MIFQDFVRYQLRVGENLGVGDIHAFTDEERWQQAARHGMADDFIGRMASGYHTQLGRWFKNCQELSGTHDALLEAKGRYATLFQLQAAGYK